MCLGKHYLGMSNPCLYLLCPVKKILALSAYTVYSHLHSLQSILPVFLVGILMQNLEIEKRQEEKKCDS